MNHNHTFIIAEAGSNHNRNFGQALALIDAAAEAGADAVKFQTYSSETLYSQHTPDFYNYKNITQLIKDIELPREWQKDLKAYCDDLGIEFMSSPFDEKAVDELVALGVKRIKIAGFESRRPALCPHGCQYRLTFGYIRWDWQQCSECRAPFRVGKHGELFSGCDHPSLQQCLSNAL